MAWTPKDTELAAMLSADGKQRYEYFIHRVCDAGMVWGLRESGWAALGDSEERKLFSVWPHEKYAELFKASGFEEYQPEAIDLDAFVDEWLPNMRNVGVYLAVFPIPTGEAIAVSADDLAANLRDELSKY